MIDVNDLPTLNASLNAAALVLLTAGFIQIKRKRVHAHRNLMTAAFGVSILFLISYVTYHLLGEEKKFGGAGWIRPVYFTILITHVVLAALVPVLATWTLILGWRSKIERHRRLARITWPVWMYVSVTGILVYLLLYVMYEPLGPINSAS